MGVLSTIFLMNMPPHIVKKCLPRQDIDLWSLFYGPHTLYNVNLLLLVLILWLRAFADFETEGRSLSSAEDYCAKCDETLSGYKPSYASSTARIICPHKKCECVEEDCLHSFTHKIKIVSFPHTDQQNIIKLKNISTQFFIVVVFIITIFILCFQVVVNAKVLQYETNRVRCMETHSFALQKLSKNLGKSFHKIFFAAHACGLLSSNIEAGWRCVHRPLLCWSKRWKSVYEEVKEAWSTLWCK